MSQENRELVTAMLKAFNQGGFGAVRPFLDPDVEWHEDASFPEAGIYRGIDAVADYTSQFLAEFAEFNYKPLDLVDVGEHVIANLRITGRGSTSGAEFDFAAWWAMTFRAGKVVRVFAYLDRDAVYEAVGLAEHQ